MQRICTTADERGTTMTRRSHRQAVATALLAALTLTACGGSDGEGDGAAAAEVEPGPLDEFYEAAYGEFDEESADEQMKQVEEVVAACMAEQGFEYVPVDQTQGSVSMPEELDVEWGTREFAEQYGYGMTTNPWGEPEEVPVEEEFVDPNAEYVDAMSEPEREAYYVALWGEQTMSEDPEEEYVYDWEQAGCQGRAQHEVYEAGMDDPAFTSLMEEMNTMWERVQQDPRVADVTTAWVDCMADAGYTGLATVDDAQMRINDMTNKVYEEAYSGEGMGPDATEEDWLKIEEDVQARLAAITEEEIATAVADFECRDDAGYEDVMQEVNIDLQQEFVDAHRPELEAWVEAVKAGRS